MEGIIGQIVKVKLPSFMIKFMQKQKIEEKVEGIKVNQDMKSDLLYRLDATKTRLSAMQSAFEHETDFDLLDAYIMEIDALEKQYSYLFKRAKQLSITNEYCQKD